VIALPTWLERGEGGSLTAIDGGLA